MHGTWLEHCDKGGNKELYLHAVSREIKGNKELYLHAVSRESDVLVEWLPVLADENPETQYLR